MELGRPGSTFGLGSLGRWWGLGREGLIRSGVARGVPAKEEGGGGGPRGGGDVVVGGRWQEGVGRVEGADGEGGLDEGAPLSKLSLSQGIGVAWMSRGEKGGESI